MDEHIEYWLKSDPRELAEQAVEHDHWDTQLVNRALDGIPTFSEGQFRLEKRVPTADALWSDVFLSFWQVEPELVNLKIMRPSHALDWVVMDEVMKMDDYLRLQLSAVGDEVASAMACLDMRQALEILWDKLKKRQEHLATFEELLIAIADSPDDAELAQQANDLAEQIETDLRSAAPLVADSLSSAVADAADNAELVNSQSALWGVHAGSGGKLDAEERLALAQRLNNPDMRLLFDMLGAMDRLLRNIEARRVDHMNQEVYELERGNDFSRMIPSQLAQLRHPVLGKNFRRLLLERGVPQVKLRGTERVGKGNVICLVDNSGSMHGARERWAKAVALCLLLYCMREKRGFTGIHFGSRTENTVFNFDPNTVDIYQVLAFAEYWHGGGTDFEAPLGIARNMLLSEYEKTGTTRADVVMITDAECRVRDSWLQQYHADMVTVQSRTWGFLVEKRNPGQMPEICNGKIVYVDDLATGEQATEMFGAL